GEKAQWQKDHQAETHTLEQTQQRQLNTLRRQFDEERQLLDSEIAQLRQIVANLRKETQGAAAQMKTSSQEWHIPVPSDDIENLEKKLEEVAIQREAARQPLEAIAPDVTPVRRSSWRWPGKAVLSLIGVILGILIGIAIIMTKR